MPCAIVERMVVLDEDFSTGLTLVEGDGVARSFLSVVAERTPREWRLLYEREHAGAEEERARADAAQARCEELRWAEVASRSDAGSWKSRFKACRRRLSEAVEETKEARRAARDVPSLQAEVARLENLLWEAGIESSKSPRTRRYARKSPGCARPWRRPRPERARSARGPCRPVGGVPPWSDPRARRTPSGRCARHSASYARRWSGGASRSSS